MIEVAPLFSLKVGPQCGSLRHALPPKNGCGTKNKAARVCGIEQIPWPRGTRRELYEKQSKWRIFRRFSIKKPRHSEKKIAKKRYTSISQHATRFLTSVSEPALVKWRTLKKLTRVYRLGHYFCCFCVVEQDEDEKMAIVMRKNVMNMVVVDDMVMTAMVIRVVFRSRGCTLER